MHRYALIERERRFLVRRPPPEAPSAVRHVFDRYIDGTRLRLRRMDGVFKLGQKIPSMAGPPGLQGDLTNMYLSRAEYDVLSVLPAAIIRKTRHSFPPLVLDVFEGHLTGLLIAEVEFDSDEAMAAFQPPAWCMREISMDPRYTGGVLARLSPGEATLLIQAALQGG
ncbi:MAG TPA: hypothetical protein VGO93_14300 [Candidatus Xenobia bacterium]|jgi:CYTH domain-containing protein